MKKELDDQQTTTLGEELGKEHNLSLDELAPLEPKSRRELRALAFHYVYAVDRNDYQVTLEDVVEQFAQNFNVLIPDDSYALTLATGGITHRDEMDSIMAPVLENWKIDRLGVCTRLIMRMALWEMKYGEKDAKIVINEAIELAKAFAEKDSFKFVNGVLDEIATEYGFHKVEVPEEETE